MRYNFIVLQVGNTFGQFNNFLPTLATSIDKISTSVLDREMEDFINHRLPEVIDASLNKVLEDKLQDLESQKFRQESEDKIQIVKTGLEKDIDALQDRIQEETEETGHYQIEKHTKTYTALVKELKETRKSLSKIKNELGQMKEKDTSDKQLDDANESGKIMTWNIMGVVSLVVSIICLIGLCMF